MLEPAEGYQLALKLLDEQLRASGSRCQQYRLMYASRGWMQKYMENWDQLDTAEQRAFNIYNRDLLSDCRKLQISFLKIKGSIRRKLLQALNYSQTQ